MESLSEARTWVRDLRENQRVDEVFLVASKSLRYTRSHNPFLALKLQDQTGSIQARIWNDAEALDAVVVVGGYVRVRGQIGRFDDSLQLNVVTLEVPEEESLELDSFLPASSRRIEDMEKEYSSMVERVGAPHLRALLESFLGDQEFWAMFRRAPAAQTIHHAFIGGLLEHTLAVSRLCLDIASRYACLDADLLLTGALLHDVGKTRELRWTRNFGYSDEGYLVGHIVLGTEMVTERAKAIGDFPSEAVLLMRHMILSHHGQREFGSPKRPKTREAMALHYADDLDGKLNIMGELIRAEVERDPEVRWTPYNRVLERYVYLGGRNDSGLGPDEGA